MLKSLIQVQVLSGSVNKGAKGLMKAKQGRWEQASIDFSGVPTS